VACGSGRDAAYLAVRGFEVEAIDVLPDALSRAEDLARRSGVSIRTRVQDLEREPVLPRDRYHLLVVFRFLQRSLFPALRDAIRPGGYVVYETFHELNARTGRKPRSPDHLLSDGELARAFEGFDVLIQREAQERDGRFFSSLLARKPEE
jgi:tellurite methyltransferase